MARMLLAVTNVVALVRFGHDGSVWSVRKGRVVA